MLPDNFRVMKADAIEPKDFKNLKYPVYASIKLDGIRGISTIHGVTSSSNKLIPNKYIQRVMREEHLNGLDKSIFDGELVVGETFQSCTSGIMSEDGEPNFTFWIFDWIVPTANFCGFEHSYRTRIEGLETISWRVKKHIKVLKQYLIHNEEELLKFYTETVNAGHEGIIVRDPNAPYKFGRATKKQGWMLKVKPFEDAEAIITGFEEGTTNLNDAYINEKGLMQRSAHKENKIPNGSLGKFNVKDVKTGVEFNIGTGEGLTHELRQKIWDNQSEYLGKIVKYKTQKIGTLDKPRIPIFMGFRDPIDM